LKCGYGEKWRKKISWVDKISNEELLAEVEETTKIIQRRQRLDLTYFEASESDIIEG